MIVGLMAKATRGSTLLLTPSGKQSKAQFLEQSFCCHQQSFFLICIYKHATKDELHKAQLEEPVIAAPFSVSMRKTTRQVMELPRSEITNDNFRSSGTDCARLALVTAL